MMISTRGRYALRVMIDLAQRQDISLKYLEKILPVLAKNNYIQGVHGKGGGYKLTREPKDYKVGEILRLTEGDLAPVACLECGAEPCQRASKCRTLSMWSKFNSIINEYFDGITIADLMAKPNTP